MTFRVNIPALGGLPPFLDRRHGDLVVAEAYLRGSTELRPGGFIDPIAPRHRQSIDLIARFLLDAAIYLDVDAGNLRDAIGSYATSDSRAAARADANLPDWPAPPPPSFDPGDNALTAEVFADTSAPTSLLVVPADQHSAYPYRPGWSDILSPTTLVRDAIWGLTKLAAEVGLLDRAYDPFELFVDPFTGDWAGLLECVEVFTRIADLLDAERDAVVVADRVVPLVWTGHASDACQVNLARFAAALGAAADRLRQLAGTYVLVVAGLEKAAGLAAQLFTTIVDMAVDSGLDEFGIGLVYTVPNMISDFASLITQFIALVHTRDAILDRGFAPADLRHPFGIMRSPLVLPALDNLSPAIPSLLPPPRSGGRIPAHV